jgi:WD40 repeat protein
VGCTYADMLCPRAVAWSPDERQVAILSHCGDFHGASNNVMVYDTADGHRRATVALDDIISQSPLFPDNCNDEPRFKLLSAYNLFWLPSGRLAVAGSVYLWTAADTHTACPAWDALVLVDANGGHAQVARADSRAQAGDLGPCGRTWDVQAASPAAASAAGDDCPLAPALGYRWADGGKLQPQTPLNSTSAPAAPGPGPVGNPDGGTQFTVWQSATVSITWPERAPGAASGIYQMDEWLGAYSPDGRYAYGGLPLFYRLQPAGQQPPTPSDISQPGTADEPLLPVKDAALRRVLAGLPPPAESHNEFVTLPTALAWRPDGTMLAALGTDLDSDGKTSDAQQSVRLLDCASGSVRLSLTPLADPAHKQAFSTSLILSWSPDGSRLLLISGARGTATLWDLRGLR